MATRVAVVLLAVATISHARICAIGGQLYRNVWGLNTVRCYDQNANSWTRLPSMNDVRQYVAVVTAGAPRALFHSSTQVVVFTPLGGSTSLAVLQQLSTLMPMHRSGSTGQT